MKAEGIIFFYDLLLLWCIKRITASSISKTKCINQTILILIPSCS